jgi:hypothetical protein
VAFFVFGYCRWLLLLSIALVSQNVCPAQRSLASDWIITLVDRRRLSALPAARSLPATSLIFVSFLHRDSTQKSSQKIGSGYYSSLSSPDQD